MTDRLIVRRGYINTIEQTCTDSLSHKALQSVTTINDDINMRQCNIRVMEC